MVQTIYRALIVDDEPSVREATSRAMTKHSFCCDTARDGRQAIELYRKQPHDLVVTDLRMPEYHGHSLILELMKESDPPHVVVLTGVANANLVSDLFQRGVEDIVEKPVDYHVFATKMLSLFQRDHWNPVAGRGIKVGAGQAHHPRVARLESSLEIFSLCIPEALDQAFSNAAATISKPPAAMMQFLEHLANKRQNNVERREFERTPFMSTAIAVPVNKDFAVRGDAIGITFKDISESGASLFSTRSFPSGYVALRWDSVTQQKMHQKAVMQIKRCEPLGQFYEVSGPFVVHD